MEVNATPFLHVVSGVGASGVEALALPARTVDVGTGSFDNPNGPEKEGLPPLETEGVVLGNR